LLLGGVVFQEVIQHATQASVIDASARPSLEVIYAKARACTRCAMSRHRERAVVGCGDPNAQLLIVTGPPSAAEEALGAPLTGPEGDLLDNMLKAMTLSRERVFITPVIKCRAPDAAPDAPSPPDLPYALAACNPFLMEELKSVHAPVVLALGDVAAQHLLGKREHLSHLRGTFHLVHGVAVMPTFHPAHLLRHPEAKPLAWRDLQRVMERLGLKRPTPPT
jgi:DNA polymerase